MKKWRMNDGGEHSIRLMAGDHVEEDPAAIACEVIAVKLDKRVFTLSQPGFRYLVGRWPQMKAAHLALREFRKH